MSNLENGKTRVVVTGMGAISPIGNSVESFWEGIRAGKCGVGPITRFDSVDLTSKVAAEVKDFDPCDYMDIRATKRMALFSQYAVAAGSMAWADAKLDSLPPADLERVSILLGNGIGGIEVDSMAHKKLYDKGARRLPAMTIPKMICNEAAGNLSMHLGTKGAVHAIVTACASGTDAMGHALDAIRAGRADVVITGGTEATVTEYAMGGFCALKALSTGFNDNPQAASRPFDRDRDGFVMGEGSGILILESYEHAMERGATIYAELGGYGGTADAYHLTAPHPEGEGAIRAIKMALKDAQVEPEQVDYINAHGTSTPVNDPVETAAIKGAFGDHAYKLKVSSTKGMTGHCIGAAGALEAIVLIKSIEEGYFPATLNLENPDPACDLDYVPNEGQEGKIDVAMSTSLGFGGHNGVIVFKKAV
jgi:3-oxoacyl-[acyl-carrier-protein] synthase II